MLAKYYACLSFRIENISETKEVWWDSDKFGDENDVLDL